MNYSGTGRKRRIIVTAVLAIVILLTVILGVSASLFREELKIVGSIRREPGKHRLYYMEVPGNYHFDEFLASGGASSDAEVSAYLTGLISKGFYKVNVEETGLACSIISAETDDGTHVWGRNFDWSGSVPIIVRCTPENGYASISTCDFKNITGSSETVPDNIADMMLAIAALYVPMDGINEAGLCAADLQVNEGGMATIDTEKPDLTITTAIRLILNQCATVEEAVALLSQYDIHASAGISHHIAIADASGASVVLEFIDGRQVVIPSPYVTNFSLANGDTSAGGESAQKRYETLKAVHENGGGVLSAEQVKSALFHVSKPDSKQGTQWSIVYDGQTGTADYWFLGDFDTKYTYSVKNAP